MFKRRNILKLIIIIYWHIIYLYWDIERRGNTVEINVYEENIDGNSQGYPHCMSP